MAVPIWAGTDEHPHERLGLDGAIAQLGVQGNVLTVITAIICPTRQRATM